MMKRILIVDDEQDVEMLFNQKFRHELRNNDYKFHYAFNAKEALAVLRSPESFDLVLSDINMPGITGLELLRIVKSDFSNLRIVMVTAYGDTANYNKATALGADDFLVKPVNFDLLKERMKQMLHN